MSDTPPAHSQWLLTTVNAVRELMLKRLERKGELDAQFERELEMALEELDIMWEELAGQAELLTREHQRYAEFFENAPDAYIITDAGGRIREANRAAGELLATPPELLAGKTLRSLIADEEHTSFLTGLIRASSPTAVPASWSSRVVPAGGEPRDVILSVRPIPLHKSGVTGLCWLLRPAA